MNSVFSSFLTLCVQRMTHTTFADEVRMSFMRFCPRNLAWSLAEQEAERDGRCWDAWGRATWPGSTRPQRDRH